MSWLSALLIYATITLATLVIATACYAIWLRFRIHKLAKDVPTAQLTTAALGSENTPIMRYSEYKHRYGSRIREIAIISNAKQPIILDTTKEFAETMREHGSLLYHFTHYWGRGDMKNMHTQASELVKGNYHAIYALGRSAVSCVRHATLTQNRMIPTIFSNIRDSWWQEEKQKNALPQLTGITGSSSWHTRIKVLVAVKPTIKNVLIPLPNGNSTLHSDVNEIISLFQSYNITPHTVDIHSGPDLLNAIQASSQKVDTVFCLNNTMTTLFNRQIATLCNQYSLTFFSPYKNSIYHGAAVAVSAVNMNLGWHAAHKMLALLEEHKKPEEIPVTNISADHDHIAYFNQNAMRLQGLDPSTLVGFSMRYGTKLQVNLEEDAE